MSCVELRRIRFRECRMPAPGKPVAEALSVSALTALLRDALNRQFQTVTVVGEVSGLIRAASGHCYLTLKDNEAKLSAVIWRNVASSLRFDLTDGQEVICRGGIEVYPPRGNYQLVIRAIQPVGIGALELAFQQLHQRLSAEGLFDEARKRPIPAIPRRVAVVTSPQGAAIRDFVEVLGRRWPAVQLTLVPTRVQGEGSAREIAAAIGLANRVRPAFDVIVVCRGGGSIEDLWAFNEEPVCRAVAASPVPIVSGVGHETDVTLCDLVADLRALTPSEAAERLVPDRGELLELVKTAQHRLSTRLRQRLETAQQTVDWLSSRPVLARPLQRLEVLQLRLRELALQLLHPMKRRIESARHMSAEQGSRLESLSPLAVLRRGFSITTTDAGAPVRSVKPLSPGEPIRTRVADGELRSVVAEILAD
jgi:exodeoxyribonuclease VII large subunit